MTSTHGGTWKRMCSHGEEHPMGVLESEEHSLRSLGDKLTQHGAQESLDDKEHARESLNFTGCTRESAHSMLEGLWTAETVLGDLWTAQSGLRGL